MDLAAEFYLETIERVFQRHLLPEGQMVVGDRQIRPSAIADVAMMTIEGGKDDITGEGQTRSALELASNVPASMRTHYTHPDVGHYGVFNGGRWRRDIQPRVAEFIREHRGS